MDIETKNRNMEGTEGSIDRAYVFEQIRAVQAQDDYLKGIIRALSEMSDGDSGDCGSPGNSLGAEKAKALGDIVRCRETTNQQLLSFYTSVYNDLKA